MHKPWRPVELKLYVTRRCNMGCIMCDRTAPDDYASPELSLVEIFRVILEARMMGIREVILFGGEPTVRIDLPLIVKIISLLGMKPFLVSNGWNIDAGLARSLVRAGLRGARLALESPDPDTHDHIRGRSGSHERVCAALAHLRNAGKNRLQLSTHTVILQDNYGELPDLLKLLTRMGVDDFTLTPFIPPISCIERDPVLEQQNLLRGLCRPEIEQYNAVVAPQLLQGARELGFRTSRPRIFVFGNDEEDLEASSHFLCSRRLVRDAYCFMPWYRINVLADGSIVPCAKTRRALKKVGSIRRRSLRSLWSSRAYREFRGACATTGSFPKISGCERCCVHVARRNFDLFRIVYRGALPQVVLDPLRFPRYFPRPE